MLRAIEMLEKNLREIEAYNYPAQMQKPRQSLRKAWEATRSLFERREKVFVSNLMVLSSEEMESITREFILYHRKAQ
jgi:hypothetical protein